jgi:hypothetical protein
LLADEIKVLCVFTYLSSVVKIAMSGPLVCEKEKGVPISVSVGIFLELDIHLDSESTSGSLGPNRNSWTEPISNRY